MTETAAATWALGLLGVVGVAWVAVKGSRQLAKAAKQNKALNTGGGTMSSGATTGTTTQTVSSVPLRWVQVSPNARQLTNARTIVQLFRAAGYSDAVAAAAVANAWWESNTAHPVDGARGLNERAIGDGGKSVGVYQMHENGAGSGMTVAQRMDVANATREMIAREMKTSAARALLQADLAGESLSTLVYLFGRDIERPWGFGPNASAAEHTDERNKRDDMARRLWGSGALATPAGRVVIPWA